MGMKMHKSASDRRYLVAWALLAVGMTICLCFANDLQQTSNCSLAYLQGHIKDFYEYNIANHRGADYIDYYPTIYILYALWNLPLHLLKVRDITCDMPFALLWSKLFCIAFLALAYVYMRKLALRITNCEDAAAMSVAVLMGGIPVFFLFSFPWALYDTPWLAMLLCGIYHLTFDSGKDTAIGLAALAIAVTLKTFVLFVIVPVLCYRWKKLPKLMLAAAAVMSLYGLETLLYSGSEYFMNEVISPQKGIFLYVALFSTNLNRVSFVLVAFIGATMYAYHLDYREDSLMRGMVYVPFAMGAIFIALGPVTPGWAIIYMPFYAILIAVQKRKDRLLFYLGNIGLSIGELIYILSTRAHAYGESALAAGVFGHAIFRSSYWDVFNRSSEFLTSRLFGFQNPDSLVINYGVSLIAAVLIFGCLFFYKHQGEALQQSASDGARIDGEEKGVMAFGLLAVCAVYVVPILIWTVQNY